MYFHFQSYYIDSNSQVYCYLSQVLHKPFLEIKVHLHKYIMDNFELFQSIAEVYLGATSCDIAKYMELIKNDLHGVDELMFVMLARMYTLKIALIAKGKRAWITTTDCSLEDCDLLLGIVGVRRYILFVKKGMKISEKFAVDGMTSVSAVAPCSLFTMADLDDSNLGDIDTDLLDCQTSDINTVFNSELDVVVILQRCYQMLTWLAMVHLC